MRKDSDKTGGETELKHKGESVSKVKLKTLGPKPRDDDRDK